MRVCFYTLGCKVNLNETGALEQMFRSAGFTIVPEGEEADVFVVNSCTVTNFGDQKSRKWLRRAKRENPGAVTVLTGCYPQAFPEEAAQFLEADLVCGNGDRKAILENVQKLLDGHERIVAVTPHQRGELFEELPVERFETHTRAFIKVEDGCNRQCAYCVIPRARGPVRSRSEESILAVLRQLGWSHADIEQRLSRVKVLASRLSEEKIGGVNVIMQMSKDKNALACSRNFDYIRSKPGKKELLVMMNCMGVAKSWSENPSWMYDTDFEFLNSADVTCLVCAGPRAYDYRLRLLLAGIPDEKIRLEEDEFAALKLLPLRSGDDVYILYGVDGMPLAFRVKAKLKEMLLAKEDGQ